MGFEAMITATDASVIDQVAKTANDLGFLSPRQAGGVESVHVAFAFPQSPGDEEVIYKSFQQVSLGSIVHNYTPDVVEKTRALIEVLKTSKHGLVIINGPVGTGKTWLIRSILSEVMDRSGIACTPPLWFLEQARALNNAISGFHGWFHNPLPLVGSIMHSIWCNIEIEVHHILYIILI